MQSFKLINFLRRKNFPIFLPFSLLQNKIVFFKTIMDKKDKKSKKNPAKVEIEIPKSIYAKEGKIFVIINAKPNSKINSITGNESTK